MRHWRKLIRLMVAVLTISSTTPLHAEETILQGVRSVHSMALSPDGKLIAAGESLGRIRVWNHQRNEVVCELSARKSFVAALAFGQDNNSLYAVTMHSDENKKELYCDVDRFDVEKRLVTAGHSFFGKFLALSADASILVTAQYSQREVVFAADLATKKQIVLKGHAHQVEVAVVSPDGKVIVTSEGLEEDGQMATKIWDFPSGRERLTINRGKYTQFLSFARDGSLMTSGLPTQVWDVTTGQVKATCPLPALAISPDGKFLALWGIDFKDRNFLRARQVQLWSSATGKMVKAFPIPERWDPSQWRFAPDGRYLAVAAGDGSIRVWDLAREGVIERPDGK